MRFEGFISDGKVRKASSDKMLAVSLLRGAEKDLQFLGSLEINEISARKLVVGYYDILRSILEAISALDGYKVYSHEAFTYFLKKKQENVLADKFDIFRKRRNRINYYGENISPDEAEDNINEMKKVIKVLIGKYLKGLK
jgi:hypothetical protein